MNIESLLIFVDVVRSGSFTAVAKKRQVAVSSISRTVTSIENNLGIRLIQRTTRKISLTESGQAYFDEICRPLEAIERAGHAAQNTSGLCQGSIRITAPPSFGATYLAPRLANFSKIHPKLSIALVLTDKIVDMVEERFDLAIRQGPFFDSTLISVPYINTYYQVCASEQYLKENAKPEQPEDLVDHKCIVFPLPKFDSLWRFKEKIKSPSNSKRNTSEIAINVSSSFFINNGQAMKQCAINGGGIVLLSNWLIQDSLGGGELVDIFPQYNVTATDYDSKISFLYPTREFVPEKVKIVIDFLRNNERKKLYAVS